MATGLAHKTAKRLLAMAEFSNQFPISFGLFDRIKVLALDILNESDFQRFRIVEIANNGWNAMELGPLSGPPASLAGNDLVAPALRPHNDGLTNATLGNRSEEHTSELQSLMRHAFYFLLLKKKK